MEEQEIGNIFPDERYEDDDDHRLEDGRKNDVIKDNEESDEDEDDESDDDNENEDGTKKKKKKKGIRLDEKKKIKRKVERFTFKQDMLTNQDRGIKFLYENVDKIKLFDKNEKGVFDELKALDKLVNYYKGWHFHFMPKYDYQYFLDRCSDYGKKNLLKSYMNNVRRIHKGEIQWKDLANDLEQENQENNENTDNQAALDNQNEGGNNAQPQNGNQNNNTSLMNDTNISRTIDTNKIPKHIKDMYLPSNSQIKKNIANDSSYARSYNVSRNPNQTQNSQSQNSSMVDKSNLSQNKKLTPKAKESEDYIYEYEKEDDEEMDRLRQMDEELRILQEEIGKQEKMLQQIDNLSDSDDLDDIKIKKIQKDD